MCSTTDFELQPVSTSYKSANLYSIGRVDGNETDLNQSLAILIDCSCRQFSLRHTVLNEIGVIKLDVDQIPWSSFTTTGTCR